MQNANGRSWQRGDRFSMALAAKTNLLLGAWIQYNEYDNFSDSSMSVSEHA